MIEVFYAPPPDQTQESSISESVALLGGRLINSDPYSEPFKAVCLIYEFENRDDAKAAVARLRDSGFHVEGPIDYGD